MISSAMVGAISYTSGASAVYSTNGYTSISSISTVQSGSNYIDRTTATGGLVLGNGNTNNKFTYLNLNNLSKTNFQSTNCTFYLKFKMNANTVTYDRAFTFCNSYTSGVSDFIDTNPNAAKWDSSYYESTTAKYDNTVGTYSQSNVYHVFVVFNTNNTNGMYMYTDGNSTANFTNTSTTTSSTVFNNYLLFSIGHAMFSSTGCSNITIFYTNLLPVALSTTQMGNIATGTII